MGIIEVIGRVASIRDAGCRIASVHDAGYFCFQKSMLTNLGLTHGRHNVLFLYR